MPCRLWCLLCVDKVDVWWKINCRIENTKKEDNEMCVRNAYHATFLQQPNTVLVAMAATTRKRKKKTTLSCERKQRARNQ